MLLTALLASGTGKVAEFKASAFDAASI